MPEVIRPPAAFDLGTEQFERVRQLIGGRAGIALAPGKQPMVYSRLVRRLRELGDRSFDSYLDRLADPRSPEWEHFVNALTTNQTAFFREPYHFPVLAGHLRERASGPAPVRVWCAAASTGEEPYSIAITALEALGDQAPVEILATDIDTEVLARARQASYAEGSVEGLPRDQVMRHFQRGRAGNAGRVRPTEAVRRLVRFGRLNLVATDWQVPAGLDAIFCRNVMIYFSRETQRRILERMHPLLLPGGLLFAGHSESFADCRDLFVLQGRTVYRRLERDG